MNIELLCPIPLLPMRVDVEPVLLGRTVQLCLSAAANGDVGAQCGEILCHPQVDSTAATGYEYGLTFE